MNILKFEDLPQLVGRNSETLEEVRNTIKAIADKTLNTNEWMNLEQFKAYIPQNPSQATLYRWLSQGKTPGRKKGAKWYFLRSEVDEWLLSDENADEQKKGAKS